jgi:hypothetical protein
MREGNSGLIVVTAGKQSNMATVVGECTAVLCRVLEAVQANEDPRTFCTL